MANTHIVAEEQRTAWVGSCITSPISPFMMISTGKTESSGCCVCPVTDRLLVHDCIVGLHLDPQGNSLPHLGQHGCNLMALNMHNARRAPLR